MYTVPPYTILSLTTTDHYVPTLPCTAGSSTSTPLSGGLLALPEASRISRRLIKVLEAAALPGSVGDRRVPMAAAWMLADACERLHSSSSLPGAPSGADGPSPSAPGSRRSGSSEATTRPIPLASYPLDSGAHRPLTEAVKALAALAPLTGPQARSAAAAVRCLAASPRLPANDWDALCRRLWQQPRPQPRLLSEGTSVDSEGGASKSELQEAVLKLALAHGSDPSHNLASFLDELASGTSSSSPSIEVQTALFSALPSVLSCLAGSRHRPAIFAPILIIRESLHEDPQDQPRGGIKHEGGLKLLAAYWTGLRGLMRPKGASQNNNHLNAGIDAPASNNSPAIDPGLLREVLVEAMQLLPTLPPLMPGEVAVLRADLIANYSSRSQESPFETARAAAPLNHDVSSIWKSAMPVVHDRALILLIWTRAARCLMASGKATTASVLEASDRYDMVAEERDGPEVTLRGLQMRCFLCLSGALSYMDLAVCRCAKLFLVVSEVLMMDTMFSHVLPYAPCAPHLNIFHMLISHKSTANFPHLNSDLQVSFLAPRQCLL